MRHVTIRFANILAAVLLVTATTTALVIDRQAANVQLYNTTVTCGQAFFGGCCTGTLDMYGNNPSCKCWSTVPPFVLAKLTKTQATMQRLLHTTSEEVPWESNPNTLA